MSGINRPNFNLQGLMSKSSMTTHEKTPSPPASRISSPSTPPQGMSTPPRAMAGRAVSVSTPPQGMGAPNPSTPPQAIIGKMAFASNQSTPPQGMVGKISVPATPSFPATPALARTRLFQRPQESVCPPTPKVSHIPRSQGPVCPPTPCKRSAAGLPERRDVARRPRMEAHQTNVPSSVPYLNGAWAVAKSMESRSFSAFELTVGNKTILIMDRVQHLREGDYVGHEEGFNAYLVKVMGKTQRLEDNMFVLQVFNQDSLHRPEHAAQLLRQRFERYQQSRAESVPCFDFEIALTERQDPAQASHGCSLIKFVPRSYLAGARTVTARMDAVQFFPFSLNIGNKRVEITNKEHYLGNGSYFDAYLVRGNGLKDEVFVLKTLKKEHLNAPKETSEALNNEFQRYQELKSKLAPLGPHIIAPHFNFDMAIEQGKGGQELTQNFTDGCYLVQYVPNQLANYVIQETPTSKPYNFVERRELYPAGSQPKLLDNQLKELIAFAYHNKLPLDLVKGNVGFDDQGRIVVYDPMVPDGKEHGDVGFMHKSIDRCLLSFAPEGSDRFKYLDPRLSLPRSV